MTKQILKNLFLFSVLVLFFSCRNEYLVNDEDKTFPKTTARQIQFKEIRQIPNLIGKISEIKTNQNKKNSKIYIDSLNGFSVNTDNGLLIENENQTKTYTFKIERNPPSSLFENLVLKDIGNGEYDAYISQYDSILLQNENPSPNDIQNYFNFNYIGKKTDVFERYTTCNYTLTSQVYVEGHLCVEGLHSFGQACAYSGTSNAATQGYYTTEFTTIYYDCQSDTSGPGGENPGGGPGGGSLDTGDDVPTTPYPPINNNNVPNPCQKIVSENVNAKNLLAKSPMSSQNTAMKATISTDANEKAFIFGKNSRGLYKTSDIITGTNGYNVQMPATNDNFTVEGGVHNHTNSVYEVPSPGDIYWFMHNNAQEGFFNYYYTNGALGSEYVFVITNPTSFNNFAENYPQSEYFDWATTDWKKTEKIGKDAENVYTYFKDSLGKSDEESMELAMAFVIGKYGMGIGLSKKDASGNFQPIYVQELTYISNPNSNNKIYQKTTDCNLR